MNGRFASSIVVGLLAVASCARVVSTSAVDGGGGGASPSDTGGVAPPNRPDAMARTPGPIDAAAPGNPAEFTCGGKNLGSAGCSFYAAEPPLQFGLGLCYAIFVVNPGSQPAKLALQRAGKTYTVAKLARLPRGGGLTQTYQPYDSAAGLPPGDVAVLFLAGMVEVPGSALTLGFAACPPGTEPASRDESTSDELTSIGDAFHLTSDRPVVVYDINPYGAAFVNATAASLLLPEEAWGRTNLVPVPIHEAVTKKPITDTPTYVTVIASQDDTEVSIKAPIRTAQGRPGVPVALVGQVLRLKLSAGQFVQINERRADDVLSYSTGMSGTLVTANKPVAVVGGSSCVNLPADVQACDGVHQQIPPFSAWGNQYAGVSYRSRLTTGDEPVPWMLVGAVDGTVLTYSPKTPSPYAAMPAGAPVMLKAGQVVQFWTADPFVVRSQDANHPFYLAGMMTGGLFLNDMRSPANQGAGDPEFVNVVATEQYLRDYTFFTDTTYSETSLVVVRKPGADGKFADVKLACAATPISGWKDLGALQFARVDLVTGDFKPVIPGCNNGVNRMFSAEPFSLTVWGWGTKLPPANDGTFLGDFPRELNFVSYAYPAGAGLGVINTVPDPVIIQ